MLIICQNISQLLATYNISKSDMQMMSYVLTYWTLDVSLQTHLQHIICTRYSDSCYVIIVIDVIFAVIIVSLMTDYHFVASCRGQ